MLWCSKMCQVLFSAVCQMINFCDAVDCQWYLQSTLQHNSFQLFLSHMRDRIAYFAPIQLFASLPPQLDPSSSFFLSTSILTTGCYTLVPSGHQSALPCHVALDLGKLRFNDFLEILSPTSPFWENQNARFQKWFDFIRSITINIKVKSTSLIGHKNDHISTCYHMFDETCETSVKIQFVCVPGRTSYFHS